MHNAIKEVQKRKRAMLYKRYRSLILIISFLVSHSRSINTNLLLPGNSAPDTHQSFTFNIGPYAFYTASALFYIGSKDTGAEDYALSFAAARRENGKVELRFFPMAPSKAIVNLSRGEDNRLVAVDNPLYNAQINLLTTFGSSVLTTKQGALNQVYLIENIAQKLENLHVYSSPVFNDSNGQPTAQIIGLETHTAPAIGTQSDADTQLGFFAAVTNPEGTFDGNGSGISYGYVQDERDNRGNIVKRNIVVADAQQQLGSVIINRSVTPDFDSTVSGENSNSSENINSENQISSSNSSNSVSPEQPINEDQEQPQQVVSNEGNRAKALTLSEPTLAIQGNLTAMGTNISMQWDGLLQRLYAGLTVQSGSIANALLMAFEHNGVIGFVPIAPAGVFSANNSILGTNVPGETVALNEVTTIQTSTYLSYLVVVRGGQNVYAMPLVQNPAAADGSHGQLANVNILPYNEYSPPPYLRFQGRRFIEPARVAGDVYTTQSSAAQVGGGPAPAPIVKMHAFKDAVYIATQAVGTNSEAPGIFWSQALFDDAARIKGWTAWQRTGVASGALAGFSFGNKTGDFYTIDWINGQTHSGYVTTWSGEENLETFVAENFEKNKARVQGLVDFPRQTAGFDQTIGSRVSVAGLTGYKKMMLIQTGLDKNGVFSSQSANSQYSENFFQSSNGTLENFSPGVLSVAVSGGALDELKNIVAIELVNDPVSGQSWWVVGGNGGIAVLARQDGTGITSTGLQEGFEGLSSDMAFIKIASPCNVRKLLSFGNELFALTPYSLERITISADGIRSGNNPSAVVALADLIDPYTNFADMAISGPLALLATGVGLYRSGNNVNIQVVSNNTDAHWTKVSLNELSGTLIENRPNVGPITQLLPISPTGMEKEWFTNARGIGGNIYVLNGNVSYQQAQVYRININYGVVSNSTVIPFPDFFVGDLRSFYVDLTDYRNGIQTDGGVFMVGRSAYLEEWPFISVLSPALRSSQINGGGVRSTQVMLREYKYYSLGRIIRLSALGGWAVGGDFGIRLHN